MTEEIKDENKDISEFVGREMNGSVVVSVEETKTEEGKYMKVRQKFNLKNGGYYWKEFYRSKTVEHRLRKKALERERQEQEEQPVEKSEEPPEPELEPEPEGTDAELSKTEKLDRLSAQLDNSHASLGIEVVGNEDDTEGDLDESDYGALNESRIAVETVDEFSDDDVLLFSPTPLQAQNSERSAVEDGEAPKKKSTAKTKIRRSSSAGKPKSKKNLSKKDGEHRPDVLKRKKSKKNITISDDDDDDHLAKPKSKKALKKPKPKKDLKKKKRKMKKKNSKRNIMESASDNSSVDVSISSGSISSVEDNLDGPPSPGKAALTEGDQQASSPKPIFLKIMGVWAGRKNKAKYSVPLETIGDDAELKPATNASKEAPSLDKMLERLKAKNSSDQPLPKKAAPGKLMNVQSESLDMETPYERPIYDKTKDEEKLIQSTVKDAVAFSGMTPNEIKPLVDAFEPKKFEKGATIAEAGRPERFYSIVQSGKVDFYSNEKKVGSAGAGESFGDMALQGSNVQPVSVIATGNNTVLLQIENHHFRHIVKDEMVRSEEEKIMLLQTVALFKDLDKDDLRLLSNAMIPHKFKKGENITKKFKDMPFCIIQKGSVVATDKNNEKIGPGGSLGDDVISKPGKKAKVNAKAASDGVAFTIDAESFSKVFGDFERVTQKNQDKKTMISIQPIRDSGLLGSQLQDLVSQMSEIKFNRGQDVFVRGEMTKPIMYFVRSGMVKITEADGSEQIVKPGDRFAEDHLQFSARGSRAVVPKEIEPTYSATAIADSVCGILKLEDLAAVTGRSTQAPEPEVHIFLKDLTRHRLIGEGQFGNVYLVTADKMGKPEPMALKVQQLQTKKNPDRSDAIRKETKMMRALQHRFIVKLINVYKDVESISMLMGLAPGGELFDIIHRQDSEGYWISGLNEPCTKFYAAIISDTLAFMHKQKFLYRDLKPENVLIDKDGYPVITDFGFAKKLIKGKTYTFCGTPNFVAPEVILQRGHDRSADNWSLGVLIFEMLDGDNPFWEEGMDNETLYDVICNSPYFPLPERISEEADHLISRLLEKNPSKRLGSYREKDILEHPWFGNVDMETLRAKKIKAPKIPDPIEF